MFRFVAILVALVACTAPAVSGYDTLARAAYVVDLTTGTVLLEKQADVPLPPASMSKLMTLNMLFEALQDGRITLETQFGVSSRARAMGGSSMFLNENDRPTVEQLIQGIVVLSGNDACVVVAEGLAGSEDAFARLMNDRAKDLGMGNSTFANASGWPNPNQRMSMHDLGVLASRLITTFPEYYGYFGQKEFAYDGRTPDNRFNRNPLLKLGIGADGLKTGHTNEAGYGLAGSATQGTRRIVFVITGLNSEKERAEEAERVVNWAFRQFVEKPVIKSGAEVARAKVWMGDHDEIGLVTIDDVSLLLPALERNALNGEIVYRGPIEAPISKGQQVAELVITLKELPDAHIPLYSDRDVARGGFLPRLRTAINVLYRRYAGGAQDLY
ncbi:MAG: D-alanyl-D-alanine carboxypeptidase family protein [Paracoccaceae bacterium]